MHSRIAEKYQERINFFLDKSAKELIYRDYIPLDAEFALSKEEVPFERRSELEYRSVFEKESWGEDWAHGWFRLTAVVPEKFAGRELCLRLHTGVEMLVVSENGVPLYPLTGHSVFDSLYCKERFVFERRFAAGEKIECWVQFASHGLAGCLLPDPDNPEEKYFNDSCSSRFIKYMRLCIFDREMWAMLLDMRTLAGMMNSFGIEDFRGKRLLNILTGALDIFNCDCANAPAVRAYLKERAFCYPAASTAPEVYAVGHAHLDLAYLWPVPVTSGKAVRTFAGQLSLLKKYPQYVFGASQPYLYQVVKECEPALFEEIRREVAAGRWELQGGMYVEADCNITSGESLVRQFLYGKNFFKDEFGVEVDHLWLPDVFGYSGNLPQIAVQAGCPLFLTQKLSWNEFNQMPSNSFRWYGVDGSCLLVHFPPENSYNSYGFPEQRIAAMNRYGEAGICDAFLSLYGIGDGGCGPSEEFVEYNLRQQDLDGCPKVVFARAGQFFEKLAGCQEKLPVWHGELYFENHRGTLTSQSRLKRGNRKAEQLLAAAEFICSAAGIGNYPQAEFDRLWKKLMLNQFHDILPGSVVREAVEQAGADHREICASAAGLALKAAELLFSPAEGRAVAVNSLSVTCRTVLKMPGSWGNSAVLDAGLNKLSCQQEADGVYCAVELPPHSFTTLCRADVPAPECTVLDRPVLENELIRYTFDLQGRLVSAFDKERDLEVLTDAGNVITLYHDRPTDYDAWNIECYYRHERCGSAEAEGGFAGYSGACRSMLSFRYRFGNSEMEQKIILRPGSKRLDFETAVDWRESRKMMRVHFPVDVHTGNAAFDIQYAFIRRTVHENNIHEQAQFESCGQKYADLSDGNGGVALLNDCKYGYRVRDNVLDLALLRSPRYPDDRADLGEQHFTYSFLPHNETLTESCVRAESAVLNREVLLFDRYETAGAQPVCRQVSGKGISLEVVKKAEKSNEFIIRVVECAGKRSTGVVRWLEGTSEVWECDLMEWTRLNKAEVVSGDQEITLKPFEIKTFIAVVPD